MRTSVGQEIRPRLTRPVFLSRWRSRAAITQVRSTHTATAHDIQPSWPFSAAVSRMWVKLPAPAMAARMTTGPVSATQEASRDKIEFNGVPSLLRSGGDLGVSGGFRQLVAEAGGGDLRP